jgi:hypothetical protein
VQEQGPAGRYVVGEFSEPFDPLDKTVSWVHFIFNPLTLLEAFYISHELRFAVGVPHHSHAGEIIALCIFF